MDFVYGFNIVTGCVSRKKHKLLDNNEYAITNTLWENYKYSDMRFINDRSFLTLEQIKELLSNSCISNRELIRQNINYPILEASLDNITDKIHVDGSKNIIFYMRIYRNKRDKKPSPCALVKILEDKYRLTIDNGESVYTIVNRGENNVRYI